MNLSIFSYHITYMPESQSLSELNSEISIAFCRKNQLALTYGSLSYGSPIVDKYFTGQTKNASVISWQGLEEYTNFTKEFNKLFKSNTDRIKIQNNFHINRHYFKFHDQVLPDQVILKWKSPTDRIIVPLGKCKVFSGKPLANLEFRMREEETVDDYFVLIYDSSAANSFQDNPISHSICSLCLLVSLSFSYYFYRQCVSLYGHIGCLRRFRSQCLLVTRYSGSHLQKKLRLLRPSRLN